MDERSGRVNEEMLLNPQKINRYAYAINNPYRYVDPDGREVKITVERDKYTQTSVSGRIKVESDVTQSTFDGYTLENARAGDNHDKTPIPPGSYDGFVRKKQNGQDRVQLKNVQGYDAIQIHEGNTVEDAKGCIMPGATRGEDRVNNSQTAMKQINKIIREDGTGNIRVTVRGASTQP